MRTGTLKRKGGYGHLDTRQVYGAHGANKPVSINDQYYPTSIIEQPSVNSNLHPTQKPLALLEYLVKTYTNEGDTVLDFTMGSGTTGHACANTGRRFIGIERDPHYFSVAAERIAGAYAPLAAMEAAS